jgi:hypothetical protein
MRFAGHVHNFHLDIRSGDAELYEGADSPRWDRGKSSQ